MMKILLLASIERVNPLIEMNHCLNELEVISIYT